MRVVGPAWAATLLFVPACDGAGTADGAAEVPIRSAIEDVYTVDVAAGDDLGTFGRVRTIAFDADGNLHILDMLADQVVVVDPEGRLARTVGAPGDGPGELATPLLFALLSDGRLAVFDAGLPTAPAPRSATPAERVAAARPAFKVYGADGEHMAAVPVRAGARWPGRVLLPLPDGRMISAGLALHSRDIRAFSLDGSEPKVFYRAWRAELEPRAEPRPIRMFAPLLHFAVLPDGRVAVADAVDYRIKVLSLDGTLDRTIGRPLPPEPVTEAIREAVREEYARMSAMRHPEIEQPDADAPTISFPREFPVIASMAADREGRIWVERTPPGGGHGRGPIDILTPGGAYVGTLVGGEPRLPAAFGPDGLMAYIETGMNAATVRVIRLISLLG